MRFSQARQEARVPSTDIIALEFRQTIPVLEIEIEQPDCRF